MFKILCVAVFSCELTELNKTYLSFILKLSADCILTRRLMCISLISVVLRVTTSDFEHTTQNDTSYENSAKNSCEHYNKYNGRDVTTDK